MNLFSKIFNAFKSIRLNDKNAVNGEQLDYLLISSMYAEQQSAYLNSYETGLGKSTLKTILEDYWNVFDKNDAMEILLDLQNSSVNCLTNNFKISFNSSFEHCVIFIFKKIFFFVMEEFIYFINGHFYIK